MTSPTLPPFTFPSCWITLRCRSIGVYMWGCDYWWEKKGKISISITFLVYYWSIKLDDMDNSNGMQHGLGKIYLPIKNKLRVEIRLGRSLQNVIMTSIEIHKSLSATIITTLQCAAKFWWTNLYWDLHTIHPLQLDVAPLIWQQFVCLCLLFYQLWDQD